MQKLKILYDKTANSLVVWFDSADKEFIAQEVEDDTILMKDKKGKVIGLEKLNYIPSRQPQPKSLPVEVVTTS